jgi:hypothetical protein
MFLKQIIKKILKFFGYKLIKLQKNNLTKFLDHKDIEPLISLAKAKGVLHLGAHKGQEADIYQWFGKKLYG